MEAPPLFIIIPTPRLIHPNATAHYRLRGRLFRGEWTMTARSKRSVTSW
jgi:hypothetical protein